MTRQERIDMFSKEYLSISDISKLYDINKNQASQLILRLKNILTYKKCQGLRLEMRGRIHIQDYLDSMDIKSDRYSTRLEVEEVE